jgi:probable phosphoglycerate mutase
MSTPRRFSQAPYQGPTGATELFLVRHGASADAIEGEEFELIEGQGDPPHVTTLRRTVETAAPLIRRTGLTPQVEPDLRRSSWENGRVGSFGRRSPTPTPWPCRC